MRHLKFRPFAALAGIGALLSMTVLAAPNEANQLAIKAKSRFDAGDSRGAELLYGQALQQAPGDVGAAMALVDVYIAQQRFDDADRFIATWLQTHGSDYRVWKARGVLRQLQGDAAQARAAYEQAYSLGGKEDRFVVSQLQNYYEASGDTARKKQMDNVLQAIHKKPKL